jgi:hypothetical protein
MKLTAESCRIAPLASDTGVRDTPRWPVLSQLSHWWPEFRTRIFSLLDAPDSQPPSPDRVQRERLQTSALGPFAFGLARGDFASESGLA